MCPCRILSLYGGELLLPYPVPYCSLAPSPSIGAIYVLFCSKLHPTPHVSFLASWRSLTRRSKCDALLEIIHIIRCKVLFVVGIFSTTDRSWARLSRVPKNSRSTAVGTQEILRVKRELIFFPGKFFLNVQTNGNCVR